MREKLQNSRGETLVEVLAAVVVCSLSITLLLGAVSASTNIDLRAQSADTDYYTALSRAERQSTGDIPDSLPADLSVTVKNETTGQTAEIPNKTDLNFYGTGRLLSYALPPRPDGTGGFG